ncbi:class I SAM-dependent methyltransferase [Haliangium sp.]|uniref:class I SAM-dependent methyltransferase n=1 Tax=Haliangium sp. TaxID=2663208 RepID=UPI003D137A5A
MEETLFDAMDEHSERHWWFRARRRVVTHLLDHHLGPSADARVLDLGCGVGTNLDALARYGRVHGADTSAKALALCRRRFDGPLAEIHLPDRVPFPPASFDLVVMFDVLEHIEDDRGALAAVYELLAPEGTLCLTVPALRWLWSHHDVAHHHHRRYHRDELGAMLNRAGFEPVLLSYMNSLLLPLMGAARLLIKPRNQRLHGLENGTGALGHLLYATFAFERHLLTRTRLPAGGSLVALARRPR